MLDTLLKILIEFNRVYDMQTHEKLTNVEIMSIYKMENDQVDLFVSDIVSSQLDNVLLFPSYSFLSYDEMREIVSNDSTFQFKERGFLPVMSDLNGDFISINVQEFQSASSGVLYYTSMQEEDVFVSFFDNFSSFNAVILRLYKDEVIHQEGELMDMDFDAFLSIGARLNPHSEYWI